MKEDHNLEEKSIPKNQLYTPKQGQYLAFIYNYTKVNGRAPAETDLERFFRVSAPSVHQMIVELEKKQLIRRVPRQARSITVLIDPETLPTLV